MGKFVNKLLIFILFAIEGLLIVRFFLKLVGVDDNFVYRSTQVLLSPFVAAFPSPSISGKSILEFTTLFAMFIYAFLTYLAQEIMNFFKKNTI